MGHPHYVMDLYFPDPRGRDGFRRDVMRIFADDDAAALAEAARLDGWKQTSFYEVRSIKTAARSGDKIIFSTRIEVAGEPAA